MRKLYISKENKNCYELQNLKKYIDLEYLIVRCNLFNVPDLSEFINLKTLSLSFNKLTSLSGFKALKNLSTLETLYLGGNLIEDLNGLKDLEGLQNLRTLDLSNNKIVELILIN